VRHQKLRSRHRRSDGTSLHLATSGAFRRGKQHGATIESHLASTRKKAEERVGPHAGNSQIGKLQLRPRIAPGFESRLAADHIAEGGWSGLHFKQERYQIYRPGDFGFLKRFRLQCSRVRYP
jgi:hypothetical protein